MTQGNAPPIEQLTGDVPKTMAKVRSQVPPGSAHIGSGTPDHRGRGPITYLEVHLYDDSKHDFAPDSSLFAYIGRRSYIHQFTGLREPTHFRGFKGQIPNEVNEKFQAALNESGIKDKYQYHKIHDRVHIYSFPDVKPDDLVAVVDSLQ